MQYGASFSHPHLKWLGIDPKEAIKEYKSLGFTWIRLGCYWNEIEKEEGKFEFKEIENLIKYCEKNKIKVVLTVGMKAPRWPEFYIPTWVNEHNLHNLTLNFIEKCINQFKEHNCIKVWQVENEPLDKSGQENIEIDFDFLNQEIELVKSLDPKRKILVSLWANELTKRGHFKKILNTKIDIIGLDLYPKRPVTILKRFTKYLKPSDSLEKMKEVVEEIKKKNIDVWITELQAEPWEPNQKLHDSENPPSFSPSGFKRNLDYALSLNTNAIFLWGFEYWLMRKTKGDLRFWEELLRLIH